MAVDLALAYCDVAGIGAAKPGGRFDHCVQHRLDIGGRAADDIEDVAGRGLVFDSDSSSSRVRACNSPSSRAFSIAMTA